MNGCMGKMVGMTKDERKQYKGKGSGMREEK